MPNPLEMSVGSPTMSVSSNIPEPSGAGARVGGLADPVPSRPKVGIPTLTTVTHTFSRPVNTAGSFSTAPGSAMGLNLPGSRPPVFRMGTVYRVLPYLLFRLGFVHHGLYPPSLILALRVLIPWLTGLSQFLSVRIPYGLRLLAVSLTLLLSHRILSWLVLLRRFYLTLRSRCLMIWLPFLPGRLPWKLATGSLFPLLVRKYLI